MSDIRKWYMRLLLMLLTGPIGLALIFFMTLMMSITSQIPKDFYSEFWVYVYLLAGLCFIGPLLLPRFFIWVSIGLNLLAIVIFIIMLKNELAHPSVSISDLVWNYVDDGIGVIVWIMFCITSIASLMPSVKGLFLKKP